MKITVAIILAAIALNLDGAQAAPSSDALEGSGQQSAKGQTAAPPPDLMPTKRSWRSSGEDNPSTSGPPPSAVPRDELRSVQLAEARDEVPDASLFLAREEENDSFEERDEDALDFEERDEGVEDSLEERDDDAENLYEERDDADAESFEERDDADDDSFEERDNDFDDSFEERDTFEESSEDVFERDAGQPVTNVPGQPLNTHNGINSQLGTKKPETVTSANNAKTEITIPNGNGKTEITIPNTNGKTGTTINNVSKPVALTAAPVTTNGKPNPSQDGSKKHTTTDSHKENVGKDHKGLHNGQLTTQKTHEAGAKPAHSHETTKHNGPKKPDVKHGDKGKTEASKSGKEHGKQSLKTEPKKNGHAHKPNSLKNNKSQAKNKGHGGKTTHSGTRKPKIVNKNKASGKKTTPKKTTTKKLGPKTNKGKHRVVNKNKAHGKKSVGTKKKLADKKRVTKKNPGNKKRVTKKNPDNKKRVTKKNPDNKKRVTKKNPKDNKDVPKKRPNGKPRVTKKKADGKQKASTRTRPVHRKAGATPKSGLKGAALTNKKTVEHKGSSKSTEHHVNKDHEKTKEGAKKVAPAPNNPAGTQHSTSTTKNTPDHNKHNTDPHTVKKVTTEEPANAHGKGTVQHGSTTNPTTDQKKTTSTTPNNPTTEKKTDATPQTIPANGNKGTPTNPLSHTEAVPSKEGDNHSNKPNPTTTTIKRDFDSFNGLAVRDANDKLAKRFSFKKLGRGLLGGAKLVGAGALTALSGLFKRSDDGSAYDDILTRSLGMNYGQENVLLSQRDVDNIIYDILNRRDSDDDASISQREFDDYINESLSR